MSEVAIIGIGMHPFGRHDIDIRHADEVFQLSQFPWHLEIWDLEIDAKIHGSAGAGQHCIAAET